MELAEAISRRRMTRNFTAAPVDPAELDALLAAAVRAPSAGFTQGVDLVVMTSPDARQRLWELATEASWRAGGPHAAGLLAAPVVVLPVADPGAYAERYGEPDKSRSGLAGRAASEWPVPYWVVDASFMVMHLLLGATDAGLGALFFRLHREPAIVLEGLGVPAGRVAIGAVAIGHAAPDDPPTSPAKRRRRGLDEVVHRERW